MKTKENVTMTDTELNLKTKRLTETAILPTKAHETDACFDIYADLGDANKTIYIEPQHLMKINTGFATEIPEGYWGAVFARSGIATKQGLRPANCVPVIDEPYRGEWIIALYNDSREIQYIHHGDRIAQFMLLPYFKTNLIEVNELNETDRGDGGFGSSGT